MLTRFFLFFKRRMKINDEIYLSLNHRHWMRKNVVSLKWPDGTTIHIREYIIDSITPYCEPGGMGMTIWFEVKYRTTNEIERVNGAHLACVRLEDEDEMELRKSART
jgi:hypothetical protein